MKKIVPKRAAARLSRRFGLGFISGVGSSIDLAGVSRAYVRAVRYPSLPTATVEDDARNLYGDFYRAVENVEDRLEQNELQAIRVKRQRKPK